MLDYDDATVANLQNGSISAYNFNIGKYETEKITEEKLKNIGTTKLTGTEVTFMPDKTIFKNNHFFFFFSYNIVKFFFFCYNYLVLWVYSQVVRHGTATP